MGRKIKSKVKIEEVFFDGDLYPRSSYNWQTGYDYAESMKVGAKFPPIILALFKGKKYLVDGKHRIEACKLNKIKEIEAIVYTGWNKDRIFIEAVKANITHGRGLSPYEKRRIALKLLEMKQTKGDVSKIVQIPLDKLENFVGQRLIDTISGEDINSDELENSARQIGKAILKSGISHLAGKTLSIEDLKGIESSQRSFYAKSQESLLSELIKILEDDLLDKEDNKVMELVKKLKILLNGL